MGRRRGDGEKEREGAHNLDKGGGGRVIEKWREERRRGRLERERGRGHIIWTRERMRVGGGGPGWLEEGGHTCDNKFGLYGIVYAINVFTAHC